MLGRQKEYSLGNNNGIYYAIDSTFGRAVITGIYGVVTDLEIPSHIESLPVTEILESALSGYEYLKRVFFPNTMKSIGEKSFYGCSNLKEAYIPDNAEFVAYDSFSYCNKDIKFHCNIGSCAHQLAQIRSYKTEPLSCFESAKSVLGDGYEVSNFDNHNRHTSTRELERA